MVYFTPAFRSSFSYPIWHIKKQVAYANHVLSECEIPVKLYIYCIEELAGFLEDQDCTKRIADFQDAKKNLLNTADIGILMCGTQTKMAAGLANGSHPPIAWVYPWNDLVFLHEVGHLFGCLHDRESYQNVTTNPIVQKHNEYVNTHVITNCTVSNFGYLVKGSNMYTIMAYRNKNHDHWIPRFSSKDKMYRGFPLGDSQNDNRGQIIKTRFQVSKFGDESGNCSHHNGSCHTKCLQNCCPMYRLELGQFNWKEEILWKWQQYSRFHPDHTKPLEN